jgi:hypothetical protein
MRSWAAWAAPHLVKAPSVKVLHGARGVRSPIRLLSEYNMLFGNRGSSDDLVTQRQQMLSATHTTVHRDFR